MLLLPLYIVNSNEEEIYFDDLQQIVNYLEPRYTLDRAERIWLMQRLKTTQKYCKLVEKEVWEK